MAATGSAVFRSTNPARVNCCWSAVQRRGRMRAGERWGPSFFAGSFSRPPPGEGLSPAHPAQWFRRQYGSTNEVLAPFSSRRHQVDQQGFVHCPPGRGCARAALTGSRPVSLPAVTPSPAMQGSPMPCRHWNSYCPACSVAARQLVMVAALVPTLWWRTGVEWHRARPAVSGAGDRTSVCTLRV